MKFKKSICFLAVFLLLLAVVSHFFLPKGNTVADGVDERNVNAYAIRFEPENSIDVVTLGDSLSYTGISPLEVWKQNGITMYNCGKTAQRMSEAYYMLKRVYQTQTPELVVLESNLLFWPSDTEGQINQTLFEAAEYYFPVFEYHNRWKNLNGTEQEEEKENNYKGFYAKREVVPYDGTPYMIESTAATGVARMERLLLKQIKKLCDAKGSKFLLLSVPSPKNYTYEKHNCVQKLAEELGVTYLDLNLETEEVGIDWKTDMADETEHLNVYGAEKVSHYLGDYLVKNYGLSDHRQEKEFQSWNEEYDRYEEFLAKEAATQ